MAAKTRCFVSSLTKRVLLMTCETVAVETFANFATSAIRTALMMGILLLRGNCDLRFLEIMHIRSFPQRSRRRRRIPIMSAVRIAEVAKLAKVSTATVSHVINKTRFVSEETKQRVLAAIEMIGYTPNVHARNLAAGSSHMLGLIISDITNPFFPHLGKSIHDPPLSSGYEVIVFNTDHD